MKIAFIYQPWDDTLPEIGGYSSISLLSYQTALRLTASGHEVIIYGRQGKDQPRVERDPNGILHIRISTKLDDIIRKPFRLLERLGLTRNSRKPLFSSHLHSVGYTLKIALDLRKQKPDIVHIHNFSQFIPTIHALNPRAKFIIHMHCEWLTQLDHNMIKKRLSLVDMVIGCSNYITDLVRKQFPEYSDRCQTIYNGVDIQRFNKSSKDKIINEEVQNLLFLGRVSPEKGVHVLLDAFGIVLNAFPDINLQIVGGIGLVPYEFIVGISDDKRVQDLAQFYNGFTSRNDHYFNQLQSRLQEVDMQKVSFVGNIPNTHIDEYYQNADIYINSSLSEALGIPILEAMASGVPVIGSKVGGIPELIKHGETGLLFQPGDSKSLADSIIHLIKDKQLRVQLQINALHEIDPKYSWEKIVDELIIKYQSLINV